MPRSILYSQLKKHPSLVRGVSLHLPTMLNPLLSSIQSQVSKKFGMPKEMLGEMLAHGVKGAGSFGLENDMSFRALQDKVGQSGKSFTGKLADALRAEKMPQMTEAILKKHLKTTASRRQLSFMNVYPDRLEAKFPDAPYQRLATFGGKGSLGSVLSGYWQAQGFVVEDFGRRDRLPTELSDLTCFFPKPVDMDLALQRASTHVPKEGIILSFAAGYPCDVAKAALGRSDVQVARAMLSLSLNTISLYAPNLTHQQQRKLTSIFPNMRIFSLEQEAHVEAVTVCDGCLPGVLYALFDNTVSFLMHQYQVSPDVARASVLLTFENYGQKLLDSGQYKDIQMNILDESLRAFTESIARNIFVNGIDLCLEAGEERRSAAKLKSGMIGTSVFFGSSNKEASSSIQSPRAPSCA